MLERFDDPYSDEAGTVLRGYDTAQICLNGHAVNAYAESDPTFNTKFCKKCGSQTTTICSDCKTAIRGKYHSPGYLDATTYHPPRFCHECDAAYPWTERQLSAARELADEVESLDENDRDVLSKSIDDLVRETPGAQVAAVRFKKLMKKAGSVAAEGFRSILVDVMSEAAKKILWP